MKIYNVGIEPLREYDLERLDGEDYEYFIYNYADFGYDGSGLLGIRWRDRND